MLRQKRIPLIVGLTVFMGIACAPTTSTEKTASPDPGLTACQDPRLQICTAHYDPVCGLSGDDYKTYGNACSACSDNAVSGHRPGACE